MPLNGTDISAFQPGSPNLGSNAFGFVKVTEGVGWESPVWRQQATALRNARDGVGYYHLMNGGNTPQAEAQYFWSKAGPFWQPGEPIALDAEPQFYTAVADPVGWTLACAQELYRLTQLKAVFYSDWDHLKNHGFNFQPLVDFDMGLWGAAYNPVGFGDPSPWPAIFVWQDSDRDESTGGDDDVLYGDLTTWRAYGTPTNLQPASSGNITPIGGFLMALTDQQQTDLYNRIMGGIPSGDATKETGRLLDVNDLPAIAKAVHTYPVPHLDPATGQDDGLGTSLAAFVGAGDLQFVNTREHVDAVGAAVKALPQVQAAAGPAALTSADIDAVAAKVMELIKAQVNK